jgi:L-ascorbate metabolism protein UlaG (beta-lactamase superfamily)
MYLTYLDSNSWLIELGGFRILLDPWLVGPLFNVPFLIKIDRPKPMPIPERIDLILLSQGFPDHAHVPTLEMLDRTIPVVASVNAAKVVAKLGYQQIHPLTHDATFTLGTAVQIQAVPGSLLGPNLIENGYILRDLAANSSIYYEPHGSHSPVLKEQAAVDVMITPIIDLKLPLVGSVIKGSQSALQAAEWLEPQVILSTAAGGDLVFEGLFLSALKASGSAAELEQMLKEKDLNTKVIDPKSGDRMEIKLSVPR